MNKFKLHRRIYACVWAFRDGGATIKCQVSELYKRIESRAVQFVAAFV